MGDHLRIGLDYTAAIHQDAGIGRYTRNLTDSLAALHPFADMRLFVAGVRQKNKLPRIPKNAHYATSRLSERNHTRMWHRLHLLIPVERWTGDIDLFHATDYSLPPTNNGTKTVITIHDLAFERYPEETMPGMLKYLKDNTPRAVKRADHVIAVSEATRADLIELYDTPSEKITVIPHGVAPRFHPHGSLVEEERIRRAYRLPPGPLLLSVGTLQPRKNYLRLIRAFAHADPDATLVIAGRPGWGYGPLIEEVLSLALTTRVIFADFVNDEDLPALYRAATAFVYPALYEGFGLPILEAMACGTPVLTSNCSSMPEVAGDAGLLVDPLSIANIEEGINSLLADRRLRESLREKGIAHARTFTWERAASSAWGVYERVLGE